MRDVTSRHPASPSRRPSLPPEVAPAWCDRTEGLRGEWWGGGESRSFAQECPGLGHESGGSPQEAGMRDRLRPGCLGDSSSASLQAGEKERGEGREGEGRKEEGRERGRKGEGEKEGAPLGDPLTQPRSSASAPCSNPWPP